MARLEDTRWPYRTLAQVADEGHIPAFQDSHRWLSNFVGRSTVYGLACTSVESGFVASKLPPPSLRDDDAGRKALVLLADALQNPAIAREDHPRGPTWRAIERIVALPPAVAKKLGRSLPLRKDWEEARPDGLLTKEHALLTLVRRKYAQDPALAQKLLATGDALILEGNTWGDTRWGVIAASTGLVGANRAGLISMAVREELGGAGVPDFVPAALPRYAGRGLDPAPVAGAPRTSPKRATGMER